MKHALILYTMYIFHEIQVLQEDTHLEKSSTKRYKSGYVWHIENQIRFDNQSFWL